MLLTVVSTVILVPNPAGLMVVFYSVTTLGVVQLDVTFLGLFDCSFIKCVGYTTWSE